MYLKYSDSPVSPDRINLPFWCALWQFSQLITIHWKFDCQLRQCFLMASWVIHSCSNFELFSFTSVFLITTLLFLIKKKKMSLQGAASEASCLSLAFWFFCLRQNLVPILRIVWMTRSCNVTFPFKQYYAVIFRFILFHSALLLLHYRDENWTSKGKKTQAKRAFYIHSNSGGEKQ